MTTASGPGGSGDQAYPSHDDADTGPSRPNHQGRGRAPEATAHQEECGAEATSPADLRAEGNDPRPDGWKPRFGPAGSLRPFRLLRQDLASLRGRYASDWLVFNQQVVASSVYIFFTNILPGITFASDLYNLTGKSWGTIEIVFSTGLCGVIFALYVGRSDAHRYPPPSYLCIG